MALKEQLVNSIKKAMQGEMDSVNLYQDAAEKSNDSDVKEFFLSRKEEERRHYNYLLDYYQQLTNNLKPEDISDKLEKENMQKSIFSESFVRRIGEDQALFSAISTALLLEKDSIDHYHKCEQETDILTLKSFFSLLAKWEMKHYEELADIQKEAERFYWQANNFEPF
ncbi:MAG: ferritin family protein [Candidatus Cloacimonetes bacterium]|jgi:rubrerythrin|nr:ferritin family protein [Candidatus Cloacimonadota bacterium]MDY0299752.1 ferritin family protein [Candidatus Cloacimonadaceae bacterium]MCB5279110.1 ferritin family protein [Candidatus Cloacimonadota bacterium]MCK9332719.1 ferritin family protein [Candidatus Cloacimonadota bacterium]MDD2211158.1 ferritin family protein [Candidatus Cloacimonadota bacterium]